MIVLCELLLRVAPEQRSEGVFTEEGSEDCHESGREDRPTDEPSKIAVGPYFAEVVDDTESQRKWHLLDSLTLT